MKTDFYLAHPLSMRHKIRDELQVPLQDLGYSISNPFYDKDLKPRQDVDDIDQGRAELYDIDPKRAREIVHGDLRAIREAESIIVYLPYPSIGTAMELFYAGHVLKKYTFVATSEAYQRHPWVMHYGDVGADTLAGIIKAIWEEDA